MCTVWDLIPPSAGNPRAFSGIGMARSGAHAYTRTMDTDRRVLDDYSNLSTLSTAREGSQVRIPMVAHGPSGPLWKSPTATDRQVVLPAVRKELPKSQSWRVDEWRDYKLFERALRRYMRMTDASLVTFLSFLDGQTVPRFSVLPLFCSGTSFNA